MEKTTGKYSTSTYEYYKNIIEVEIGWLQFLASFGKIPNIRTFDLEYQLEQIKILMLEELETFLDNNNRDEAIRNITLVNEYLEECLKKKELENVIPYINHGLEEKQVNDFIALMYVRKFVKSISNDLREVREVSKVNDSDDIRAMNVLIDQIVCLLPKVNLKSSEYNESLMEFYTGEIGVGFSKDGSGSAYIYMVIMLLDRINAYMCYMLPNEYFKEIMPVSDSLLAYDKQTYLESGVNYNIRNLIQAFDGLRNNIHLYKRVLLETKLGGEEAPKKALKGQ